MKSKIKFFAFVIISIATFELECYLLSASDTMLNVIGFLILIAVIVFGIEIKIEYKKEVTNENEDN